MAWSVGEKKNEPKREGASKVVEVHPSTKDAPDDVRPKADSGKGRDQ